MSGGPVRGSLLDKGGLLILFAARPFRMDIHTAAISSAANIGGAASAPSDMLLGITPPFWRLTCAVS